MALKRARIHPLAVLVAQKIYAQGHGDKGALKWSPVSAVVDALDEAFYATFQNVEPCNKPVLLALDVSGSMAGSMIAGSCISAREASAAMALITAATEPECEIIAFSAPAGGGYGGMHGGGEPGITRVNLSPRMRLADVIKRIEAIPMGGTDCALPMVWAARNKLNVSAFITYTDSETWAGNIHPAQALRQYRDEFVGDAKAVVVGMTSNGFTLADPNDRGHAGRGRLRHDGAGRHRGLCSRIANGSRTPGTTRAEAEASARIASWRFDGRLDDRGFVHLGPRSECSHGADHGRNRTGMRNHRILGSGTRWLRRHAWRWRTGHHPREPLAAHASGRRHQAHRSHPDGRHGLRPADAVGRSQQLNVAGFITYTDSETWAGNIHPAQALRQYRSEFVGDAKAVVVGMTSNGFTLADPNDRGMLDVVGFDTTVPAVIADFVRE